MRILGSRSVGGLTVALGVFAALPASAQVPAAPTFTKDVAPIFQAKCEACHRPESIGPMSLRTFQEARPWARSIRARVEARQMPPWHIDKTVGVQAFKNDRSLSDEQVATVLAWVDQGARQGDPKDMPPEKVWPTEQIWDRGQAATARRSQTSSSAPCRGRRRPAPTTPGGSRSSIAG